MRTLTTLVIAIAMLGFSATANASITLMGETISDATIPGSNDFKSDLEALGFDQLVYGDIKSTSRQKLTFFFHAAESGFENSFNLNGVDVFTEDNESWMAAGIEIGSVNVEIGDVIGLSGLDLIGFTAGGGSDGVDARLGEEAFGIFKNTSGSGSFLGSDGRTYFGFDDNGSGPDDNHDDIIVSVAFSSIPEPTSVLVWAGLIGLCASRRRKR